MSRPPAPPFTKTSRTSELAQGLLLWQAVTAWFRFAFQCAVTVGATVLALRERPITASFAPLGVYIYAVGGESCRNRLTLEGSARQGPDRDRAWHSRELGQGDACLSLTSGKSATPPARCIHHSRHDASSAECRLLASFAPGVASREPESRRSPAHPSSDRLRGSLRSGDTAPRTRRLAPTFRCGAFFLAASALADVPSASLQKGPCA